MGEFGPITVESTNGRILSAVSEVSSVQGPGGFFPGVNASSAWMQGYMAEVIDTGEGGTAGTFRTNLGLNTVTGTPANCHGHAARCHWTVSLAVPTLVGSWKRIDPSSELRDSIGALNGTNGYLTITSNQPIHAWASKIENGTGDPSFQIGIGALAGTVISQVLPSGSDARNDFLFIGLGSHSSSRFPGSQAQRHRPLPG